MAEVVSEGGPRGVPGNLELPLGVERLPDGRTLIADGGDEAGFGSEVIEVDEVGRIIWQFDDEGRLRFAHSARRTADGTLLVTDTTNNRLLEVARDKRVILDSNNWAGGTGTLSDGSHLHYPNEAYELPDRTILVTDRNNDRCLRVDREGKVLWSFSQEALHHPHNANPLPNGNVLVSDSDGNRVIEVNREKEIVWSYGDGTIEKLWWPRSAARLPSGNTLIADSKNHRLVEVTPRGEVAWVWQTAHVDKFYIAQATAEGTFLISSTDGHHQVIELDRARSYVWTFRNYRRPFPLYGKLHNGFFKETAEDGGSGGMVPGDADLRRRREARLGPGKPAAALSRDRVRPGRGALPPAGGGAGAPGESTGRAPRSGPREWRGSPAFTSIFSTPTAGRSSRSWARFLRGSISRGPANGPRTPSNSGFRRT